MKTAAVVAGIVLGSAVGVAATWQTTAPAVAPQSYQNPAMPDDWMPRGVLSAASIQPGARRKSRIIMVEHNGKPAMMLQEAPVAFSEEHMQQIQANWSTYRTQGRIISK